MKNSVQKFKVQRGVQMPRARCGGERKYDWPFETMKVGECFMVPLKDSSFPEIYNKRQTILRATRLWHTTGRRFSTRLMPNDKAIGVWRIA